MGPATVAPQARREFFAAAKWIYDDSPRAALRLTETFLAAAEHWDEIPALVASNPILSARPIGFSNFRVSPTSWPTIRSAPRLSSHACCTAPAIWPTLSNPSDVEIP